MGLGGSKTTIIMKLMICYFFFSCFSRQTKHKNKGERFVPGQIIETEFGPRFVPGKIHEVDGDVTFTPAQIVQTDQGMINAIHNHIRARVNTLTHHLYIL